MKKLLFLLTVLALLAGCASAGAGGETTPPQPETVGKPEASETAKETDATDAKKVIVSYEPVEPIVIDIKSALEDYDLTGDGVADSLCIRCLEVSEAGDWGIYGYHWQFLINDGLVMEIRTDWPLCPEVALYRVSRDRNYLAICQRQDANGDTSDFGLYQYREGTLEKVCDFYCNDLDSAHIFHYGAELVSLSGDRLLLRCRNQFNATAYLCWEKEFVYSEGTWQTAGKEYTVIYEEYMEDKADGLTANRPLTIYTSTACNETACTVETGGVVLLDRLCVEGGQVFFHVTDEEGREGWLKDPQEVYAVVDGEELFGLFEEAVFAG